MPPPPPAWRSDDGPSDAEDAFVRPESFLVLTRARWNHVPDERSSSSLLSWARCDAEGRARGSTPPERFAGEPVLRVTLPPPPAQSHRLTALSQQAVRLLKKVTERGPWMRDMRRAVDRVAAGDNEGALVLYTRLAEVTLKARGASRCL